MSVKTVLKSEKYGTIIGEDIQNYCVLVSIKEKPQHRKIAVYKAFEDITDDDLLNACEELVNRPIITDEKLRNRIA